MTICRMRIHKGTNTHIEFIIFIAFTMQQRLHERASMLRYTYVACLFSIAVHAERVASVRPVDIHAEHIRTRHCAPNNFDVYGTECQ